MKIELIGSAVGAALHPQQFASTYIVEGRVAIDAGCLGIVWPLDIQRRVEHVFLSHSHIDHIATLPLFIENVYEFGPRCPTIYANRSTLNCLSRDIFNDRVWPDMIRLGDEESPFLQLVEIASEQPLQFGNLTITPVALDHIVPTLGFLVEDERSAVAFVSDTLPTTRIWEFARTKPHLKAMFLEASFPNDMAWLAEKSAHLTPATFKAEYQKLGRELPVIVVHVKAAFREKMLAELAELNLPMLEIADPQKAYQF
ncbi:MAG: 3',5'-cyclic-nucleotide phosphodiesterase [Planctomycetes bacterium]|nr:3',5'-cyclic-nucleotide phosphodiesterase [Planctomycetota bacterium]